MPSINDNELKNKDLNEKVADFIRPKLEEINKNIDALLTSAKDGNLEVETLGDILNLEIPEEQGSYNFVRDLQKTAKELQQEKEKYTFLEKSNDEVLDYLDEYCNQNRLELCAEKVFLYRELGYDVEADELEAELRTIAGNRKVQKKTLNKIFKTHEEKQQKNSTPHNNDNGFRGKSDDEIVEELNKKHSAMIQMKEYSILLESDNGKLQFQKESDFKKSYQEQVVGKDEKNRPVTVADVWLKSLDKRKYNDIIFNPDPNRTIPEKDYNLWKGFSVDPEKGDVSTFREFVREVICLENPLYFDYVWAWLARMIQKPHEPAETAIVLKGRQGTGKNTFVEIVGALLGDHFSPLASIEQLLGRFDFHHANAILLHANEAIWGGDKRMLGKLKH